MPTTNKDEIPNPLFTDLWMPWVTANAYAGDPNSTVRHLCVRRQAIREYSWAVPSNSAISACIRACHGRPLLELGSGTGYWARLLSEHGVRVTAVESDLSAGGAFSPHFPAAVQGDALKYLSENEGCPGQVLFLCWPKNAGPWLGAYQGDTVVWVGETDGCTWRMPAAGWTVVDRVPLPTWGLVHDFLLVYKRQNKRQGAEDRGSKVTKQMINLRLSMSPRLPVWVPFVSVSELCN
jgi:hypothetical protein